MTAHTSALFSLPAALLLALLPAYPARAAELSDYTYTVLADGTVSITGYSGKDTELKIPASISGHAVTAIGDNAFAYDQDITAVELPESVVSIGAYAFNDCSGLLKIDFPSNLVTVGEGAFFSCTRLTEAALPDGLTTLGADAFYGCTGLTRVAVPGSVNTFGDHVFENCTALQRATLGYGLTSLPAQTFYYCPVLTEVQLPSTLQTIGDRAFTQDNALSTITLPAGLQRIGEHAFEGCSLTALSTSAKEIGAQAFASTPLSSLTLGEGVETIGDEAFAHTNLKEATLPASLTHLGTGAFPVTEFLSKSESSSAPAQGTTSAQEEETTSGFEKYTVANGSTNFYAEDGVLYTSDKKTLLAVPAHWTAEGGIFTVPDTVTLIADSAFAHCTNIQEVKLPQGLTTLGKGAFTGCTALKKITIPDGVQTLPENVFANCTSLTDITLPANLQTIADGAFLNCTALTKLDLPDTVTSVTGAAFAGCSQAITLTLSDQASYQFTEGALYTKDGKTLVAYLGGEENIAVPASVTALGDHAITAPQVKSVSLPDTVTKIGGQALGFSYSSDSAAFTLTKDFVLTASSAQAIQYAGQNGITCFTGQPAANATAENLTAGQTFAYQIANAPAQLVEYGSSNNAVAKVDAQGTVTAVTNGTADIFAVVGQQNFVLTVTVTGGKDAVDPYADYRVFKNFGTGSTEVSDWVKEYATYNTGLSMKAEDNASIANYSTNNFAYILACQPGGTAYIPQAEADFGKNGYSQFKTVAANLHHEVARYKLNENIVGYSGVTDVSDITGTGSTMANMMASIGRRFTTNIAISTSLNHAVSANFSCTGHHYMLEIYAPKDGTNGAYIDGISKFSGEYELLLNDGITLEVVDAGIRRYTPDSEPEWYIKLRIVPDEPASSPTPAPSATPTPASTVTPAPTAAPTATAAPVPTATPNDAEFFSCPKCGYHNWTATANGYRCDHCGSVVTQQLNGYPNVKGYTDVSKLTPAPTAAATKAPVKDPTAGTLATAVPSPTAEPTPTVTAAPTAEPTATAAPAPTEEPQSTAKTSMPQWLKILLAVLILGSATVLFVVLVILPRRKNTHYHRQ